MYLRPLLLLAVAGLLLLPDWSTARPGRRQVPAFASPLPCPTSFQYATPVAYAPPVYSAPVCCPPVYTPSSACPPATPAPKGPTVIPERMAEPRAADPKPPAVKGTSGDATAAPKPAPSVIRPVGNEDRLPPMQVPMAPPRAAEPQPAPPKPPAELAPPKAITGESLKPEPLPAFPLPVKDREPKADPLPTFDLPPLPPLPPPTPAPTEKPTTSKSSPLSADPAVEIYPLAGTAPADPAAARRVGFVNKSGRDLALTVAGKLTALPSGHALQLTLPAKFGWQIGGGKESEVTVPDGAPGVDVVIRR